MAATKITVRNDGSIRVEGDFEVVDQDGKVFGLAGRDQDRSLPLRTLREQAVLRWRPQESELPERHPGLRSAACPTRADPQVLALPLGKNLSCR